MTSILKRVVVASYETTDGKSFATKAEAQKHQREISRLLTIEALIKDQLPFSLDTMQYLDEATVGSVAAFIVANADALREILPKRAPNVGPAPKDESEPTLQAPVVLEHVASVRVEPEG